MVSLDSKCPLNTEDLELPRPFSNSFKGTGASQAKDGEFRGSLALELLARSSQPGGTAPGGAGRGWRQESARRVAP